MANILSNIRFYLQDGESDDDTGPSNYGAIG